MRGPSKPTSSPNVRKPALPISLRYLGLPATSGAGSSVAFKCGNRTAKLSAYESEEPARAHDLAFLQAFSSTRRTEPALQGSMGRRPAVQRLHARCSASQSELHEG